MKKFFGLFFIAGMLVFSACGSGAKQDASVTDSTIVTETPVDTAAVVADTTTVPAK